MVYLFEAATPPASCPVYFSAIKIWLSLFTHVPSAYFPPSPSRSGISWFADTSPSSQCPTFSRTFCTKIVMTRMWRWSFSTGNGMTTDNCSNISSICLHVRGYAPKSGHFKNRYLPVTNWPNSANSSLPARIVIILRVQQKPKHNLRWFSRKWGEKAQGRFTQSINQASNNMRVRSLWDVPSNLYVINEL